MFVAECWPETTYECGSCEPDSTPHEIMHCIAGMHIPECQIRSRYAADVRLIELLNC